MLQKDKPEGRQVKQARARVLGGKALVVDRRRFSAEVQSELSRAGVSVERAEVSSLPSAAGENGDSPPERENARYSPRFPVTVIATGPLTSQPMVDALQSLFGVERLFFYDAIAPIVSAESLDMSRIFEGSRYGLAGSSYQLSEVPATE
jgi:methylenetetrahydrofolate--tRNA-(uracil-5-)-methyltransferase